MKKLLFLITLLCLEKALQAQRNPYIYTIKADSVLITNSCDTAELILENHTQNVPGFLFNKGRGRTEFRRALQKVSDSLYLIGADSLKLNAWLQGGNSWGTTGIFGTKDNNHLDFYTNNAFRGRLTNTGNLLIGTATDGAYKLNVSGGPAMFSDRLFVNTFTGDYTGQLFFKNEAGDFDSYIGTTGNDMIFHVRPTYAYRFVLGDPLNQVHFSKSPTDRLIYIQAPNDYLVLDPVNLIDNNDTHITIISNGGGGDDGLVVQRGTRSNNLVDPIFTAREGTSYLFKVMRNGYVGIGAASPQAQLHTTGTVRFGGLTNDSSLTRLVVSDIYGNLAYRDASSLVLNDVMNSDLAVNGTLSAQKMRITQTGPWPDYVFSNQYKLPTLLQLEQYIKQNNHLPDVPSATEVEKKGIDVGDNQATLLKKIEELTLYMIEQEKKLRQQNEEIAEMKKQLKTLMQKN